MLKNIITILFFTAALVTAQTADSSIIVKDSIALRDTTKNVLSSSYDKQINTHIINNLFRYNKDFEKVYFNLFENYRSTFLKSTTKNIRDEQFFALSTGYIFSEQFRAGIKANSVIFSDNRTIEINQGSISTGSLNFFYKPLENIGISPYIGYTNNRQVGEVDEGLVFGLDAFADNYALSENFNMFSTIKYANEKISPRNNILTDINFNFISSFTDLINNSLDVRYFLNKKDFYFDADSLLKSEFNINHNIQFRTEKNYLLQNHFRHNNIADIFSLDATARVLLKDVDKRIRYKSSTNFNSFLTDNNLQELRYELETNLGYSIAGVNGFFKVFYSGRDEKHALKDDDYFGNRVEELREQESRKNNQSERIGIGLDNIIKFSEDDRLEISLMHNKLKYDTPSENNFDDRDELLSIGKIKYQRRITPFFYAFVSTEGAYNHLVYLFSEKSSNNNVNRVIKFSSGGGYSGKRLSSLNIFEVSANYTVYDFEDINPNFRSFSFRQFNFVDSTNYKIDKNFSAHLYSYLKLSEQGEIRWVSFKTKPFRFLNELYLEPKLVYSFNKARIGTGLRYFALKTYNYLNNQKKLDNHYISRGPIVDFAIFIENKLELNLSGWYEFVSISNTEGKEQTNLFFNMNWNF